MDEERRIYEIVIIVNITVLAIAVLISFIHIVPIICLRRFHTPNNLLTGNVCLASLICGSFWIYFLVETTFHPEAEAQSEVICFLASFGRFLVNFLWVYSFTIVSINRYIALIYPNKPFFKRRTWPLVSCAVHWLISIILSVPCIFPSLQPCYPEMMERTDWTDVYALITIIIIPTILTMVFNSLIYTFVRSSTRRVYPLPAAANQRITHNARDIRLLKHICFISIVFTLGWGPVYLLSLPNVKENISPTIYQASQIIPVISAIIIVCDLFFYNRDLRQYLKEKIVQHSRLLLQ